MCDLCYHFPCLSGCPNAEDERPVHICTNCGTPIYDGDRYADLGDRKLCEECIDGLSSDEWLDILGTEWQYAEAEVC